MANISNENQNKLNGAASANLDKMSRDVGQRIGAMATSLADTASEYAQTGRGYVKENPIRGAAVAAGVGLVVGSLLTLAFRRRS